MSSHFPLLYTLFLVCLSPVLNPRGCWAGMSGGEDEVILDKAGRVVVDAAVPQADAVDYRMAISSPFYDVGLGSVGKRAPAMGFYGMRGKKVPSQSFYGMRGKKGFAPHVLLGGGEIPLVDEDLDLSRGSDDGGEYGGGKDNEKYGDPPRETPPLSDFLPTLLLISRSGSGSSSASREDTRVPVSGSVVPSSSSNNAEFRVSGERIRPIFL